MYSAGLLFPKILIRYPVIDLKIEVYIEHLFE